MTQDNITFGNNYTLYHDDFFRVSDSIRDSSIDLAIIDPPYNISSTAKTVYRPGEYTQTTVTEAWDTFNTDDFFQFNNNWIEQIEKKLNKSTGSAFVYGTHHNIYQVGFLLQQHNLRIINSIVWFKTNAPPNVSCRTLRDSVEHIIWFAPATSKWTFNYDYARSVSGKQMRNVWEFAKVAPREKKFGNHPTQKPEIITERLIKIASSKNDKILIPFAGSGTEMKVAIENERTVIGVERDNEYVSWIKNRLSIPDSLKF